MRGFLIGLFLGGMLSMAVAGAPPGTGGTGVTEDLPAGFSLATDREAFVKCGVYNPKTDRWEKLTTDLLKRSR